MIIVENLYIKEIDKVANYTFSKGITFLTGKNGSGKTLLLDFIGKLRKIPANARVDVKSVIYMRQNFAFYSRLTVNEYLDFIMKLNGGTTALFEQFLKRYQIALDLADYGNKKIGLLSGGERRTIYVLSLLSIDRSCYVLDEPFANIDQEQMTQEGKDFLITSHVPLCKKDIHTVAFQDIVH